MMPLMTDHILSVWNMYGNYTAILLIAAGLSIVLSHYMKLLITGDKKSRYDYINKNEIKRLWFSFLLLAIGATLLLNTLFYPTTWLWFFVRLFLSSMMTIIIVVIVQNMLKFYFPFFIEKRLKKLRYSPRVSTEGNLMKLLSEEEEDVYLDEGMQAEENAYSVDYDVWIDEKTGFTKVEKYNGRLHALKCDKCNYQTLKVSKEEIIQPSTLDEEGELIKFLSCGYCGQKSRKSHKISKLSPKALAKD
jgi:hypothetical protein